MLRPNAVEPMQANRRRGAVPGAAALLLVALAVAAAEVARADEPPAFRQGMWQFERTIGARKLQLQECVSPSEDMKRQNAMLEKSGCKFSPSQRIGKTYTFTAECAIKAPDGQTVTARSTSVMTADSDSAYDVNITTTGAGTSTQERLVARRVGDCAR